MDTSALKRRAATLAVDEVESGMILGLGAGSTALEAIRLIGERLRNGSLHDIHGVPCSKQVADDAYSSGVPLTTLEEQPRIDLTIDGADEVDTSMRLIKGGGGALLREKIVAQASGREIIIIDESKYSGRLGERWALPIEVASFGWRTHSDFLKAHGARHIELRRNGAGEPFRTDGANLILDTDFGPLSDPEALDRVLNARSGIVEHGLFLHQATDLIIAYADGRLEHKTR